MPSFLNTQPQESSQIYTDRTGVVHLGLDSHLGLAYDKSHGSPPPHLSSLNSNDSFDEASSSSSKTSESSTQTRLNGDSSAATTMTSATMMMNGKPAKEGLGLVQTDIVRKPLPNGISSAVLVDRTVSHQEPPPQYQQQPPPLPNGAREPELSPTTSPKDAQARASMASTTGESIQSSPVELHIRPVNKGDIITVDSSGSPPGAPSHLVVPVHSPLSVPSHPTTPAPATPNSDGLRRNHSTPHRFSSPPHYQTAGVTPSSSSAALAPPAPGIKHRHTLEVPKVGSSRGSRDGIDAAYASGRFSPTTANVPVGGRRASLSLGRRNTRSLHSDMPRDEVIPDDDALRWAEAYRQKRASKRKRMELEDDDRVLVGTKVDESHANWVAAYNMLTGIRVSVSRTNAKLDRPLTNEDFEAKQKSTFDIAGNELVPSAKYDFKFKDYAPWVFRRLRALFGLDPADYLMSLTGKYILSELGSPGKSGSFFYFSRDYKYIIKTIHHSEHIFLRKILKDYYQHATNNPNTLLSQFYGLHRVKVPYGRKIHFVVMNNLFPPHRDIHQTFDLKGSTVGREFHEDDLAGNPRATLKDLNWLRRSRHLELGIQKKQLFLDQLRKDVALLQKLQIMDYSLLIGIHDLRRGNEENLRHKTLQVFNPGGSAAPEEPEPQSVLMRTPSKLESQRKARELRQMIKAERPIPMAVGSSGMPDELEEGQTKSDSIFYKDDGGFQATHEDNSPAEEIYYLGVIDCLTHYGIIKKIEHFWKGMSHDRTQISALPPDEYGVRFLDFMTEHTMSAEEAHRRARERDARQQAEAAAADAAARDGIPPVPTHQPPPIPGQSSSSLASASPISTGTSPLGSPPRLPEIEEVMRRAEHDAARKPSHEDEVPERVLRTTVTSTAMAPASSAAAVGTVAASASSQGGLLKPGGAAPTLAERRESAQVPAVLPVVEEAAEASSTGGRSRSRASRISHTGSERSGLSTDSDRPLTPAKDGANAGFGIMTYHSSSSKAGSGRVTPASTSVGSPSIVPAPGHPPPTPPKSSHQHGHLKPSGSTDSGYGVVGAGARLRSESNGSLRRTVRGQISRDSLEKALPPLPPQSEIIAEVERA